MADGSHTLHLVAADNAGNASSFDLSFTLDTTPPAEPVFDRALSDQVGPAPDVVGPRYPSRSDGARRQRHSFSRPGQPVEQHRCFPVCQCFAVAGPQPTQRYRCRCRRQPEQLCPQPGPSEVVCPGRYGGAVEPDRPRYHTPRCVAARSGLTRACHGESSRLRRGQRDRWDAGLSGHLAGFGGRFAGCGGGRGGARAPRLSLSGPDQRPRRAARDHARRDRRQSGQDRQRVSRRSCCQADHRAARQGRLGCLCDR